MRHRKSKISISLIFFLFLFWVWKDYKKIDISYVNQSGVTYAYKNLNSNFLKKIHKKTDKFIEETLVTYFSSHRNHWKPEDNATRASLPQIIKIKSKNNFTLTNNDEKLITDNWYKSHGNDKSVRFSNLDLINNKNASKLKLAWTFTSDGFKGDIQANPIVVNGIIYTPISGGFIAAIDGATGNLIWKSKKFGDSVARRGLTYWAGNKKKKPKSKVIIFK